ncbi:MFS transporter [Oceanimonas baumannii]|uniref:CynX/NimT family MFS transporter n=1 Tax=Oceanimonas baumannii TaxID=129578 RepID=UPI001D17F77A|nr:MFS transporter [Oceanimonas baumannii]MCC4265621.1 MFS transporter [Oceanimonas baumannii]
MSTPSAADEPFYGRPFVSALAVMALLLAAANLRGGLVVVGPLVDHIRAGLNISAGAFSLLTTLPLICFGIISLCVPALSRRWAPQTLAIGGLLIISLGVMLRLVDSFAVVLLGTLLLGAAIALLNVLIPGLVKAFFPRRVGLMTGLYSVTLSMGAGLGVYLAVPLLERFGHWHYPVALWALLPLICALFWLPMIRVKGVGRPAHPVKVSLWRDKMAWAITFYMGLQSFYFYSMATWLPKILLESGLDANEAGTATALINLVSIPFNFLVPIMAARLASQHRLVLGVFLASFLGVAGLWWQPASAPLLWASLIGVGCGGSLSLALSFFVLRATNTAQATALSAMAQSIGYLLAAAGPAVLGIMRDWEGAWQTALILMLALQLLQLGCGWFAARPVNVVPDQDK